MSPHPHQDFYFSKDGIRMNSQAFCDAGFALLKTDPTWTSQKTISWALSPIASTMIRFYAFKDRVNLLPHAVSHLARHAISRWPSETMRLRLFVIRVHYPEGKDVNDTVEMIAIGQAAHSISGLLDHWQMRQLARYDTLTDEERKHYSNCLKEKPDEVEKLDQYLEKEWSTGFALEYPQADYPKAVLNTKAHWRAEMRKRLEKAVANQKSSPEI